MIKKGRPIGVSIIAIMEYIGAGLCFFYAIFLFTLYAGIVSLSQFSEGPAPELISSVLVFLIFIFLAFSVIGFFVGRALWNGRNWSRVLFLVFWWIGIAFSLIMVLTGSFIFLLEVVGLVFFIWYFQFKENVKNFFSS